MPKPLHPGAGGFAAPAGRISSTDPEPVSEQVTVPRLELCVEREAGRPAARRVVLDGEGALWDAPPSAPGAELAAAIDLERPFKDAKEVVIASFERSYLTALLTWADGNVSRAARKANLDRMYLHRLLQRHGLRRSGPLGE